MAQVVAREAEKKILDAVYLSAEAELVVVYGRRRVGKTYLVKHYLQKKEGHYFQITGIKNGALAIQLERFSKILSEVFYHGAPIQTPNHWMEAFEQLTAAINRIPASEKVMLFFDELPWLAGRRSGFLPALEYFWNRHWVDDERFKLVVCGSSSSWMLQKVIRNRAGLHNRVTRRMRLLPMTLAESDELLKSRGVQLSHRQLLKLYMTMGGVPYYLKHVVKHESIDQNINRLFFDPNGLFFDEFDEVFFSLFDDAEAYKELIRMIVQSASGVSREHLKRHNKRTGEGGYLSKRLDDLESSGFITKYMPYEHQNRGQHYRIADEYCCFYLKWIEPVKFQLKQDVGSFYWMSVVDKPAYYVWAGLAFENICYKHLAKIKQTLGVPLATLASPWRCLSSPGSTTKGAQIDLVLQRPDHAVTLCEIKYTEKAFVINQQYAEKLENKRLAFVEKTKTQDQIFLAMISAAGLKNNAHADAVVDQVVTLEDLF